MRNKGFAVLSAVLCLFLLCSCGQQNANAPQEAAAEPAPSVTEEAGVNNSSLLSLISSVDDDEPEGQITGTVVSQYKNAIAVNVGRSTFVFMLTLIPETQVSPGDIVTVHYIGDTALSPGAISVVKNGSSTPISAVSGVVTKFKDWTMHIQTITGSIFGFALTEDTLYEGSSWDEPKIGDAVMVNYTGELIDCPIANGVTLLSLADEGPLANRTIKGKVTALSADSITILASDGNSYTFKRNADTEVSGNYALTVGATVRITFDGYAARSPLAKHISVIAPLPTPTPRPTPAPTPSPTPKPTPTPTCKPTATPGKTTTPITPTPLPTITTSPVTPTPLPTITTSPVTPVPTITAVPSITPSESPSPSPSESPSPSPSESPSPSPSEEPSPSPTQIPSDGNTGS